MFYFLSCIYRTRSNYSDWWRTTLECPDPWPSLHEQKLQFTHTQTQARAHTHTHVTIQFRRWRNPVGTSSPLINAMVIYRRRTWRDNTRRDPPRAPCCHRCSAGRPAPGTFDAAVPARSLWPACSWRVPPGPWRAGGQTSAWGAPRPTPRRPRLWPSAHGHGGQRSKSK